MNLYLASDHAAIVERLAVHALVEDLGFEVFDLGPADGDSVDYPDFAQKLCEAVVAGENHRGILLCGTGIGMSISANKVNGIRAALVHDRNTTMMSRQHNDANVLCLGARVLSGDFILELVKLWLETDFEGGRHARRVDKMMALENHD